MSDSTLSNRASLLTEDRAEEPWKKQVNNQISHKKHFSKEVKLMNIFSSKSTWSSASVNEGIFGGGLLIIKVKLSWG